MSVERLVEQFGDASWSKDLGTRFPKFAEGLARVGDIVSRDGAMPAAHKHLCVAAIGAAKGNPPLTTHALGQALEGGLTVDEAWGAAISVLLSRGTPAFEIFHEALAVHRPGAAAGGEPFDGDVEMSEILAYFTELYGSVPPNVDLGSREVPLAIEGYYLMRTAALEESPLSQMLADLMLLAVNAADYRADFVEIHARSALRFGATAGQLAEAAACSIPYAGVAGWLPGATGVIAALENP